jgi:hypothetical protein
MASSSKKRTTMAKLAREHKLRERRAEKQARKDARRDAAADPGLGGDATPPGSPGGDLPASEDAPVTDASSPPPRAD